MAAPRDTLSLYRQKRDFSKTSEPAGAAEKQAGHRYLIQKHDATRLHYDFRLELDGVLKSWAVTRGPSLDPHEKRLAVEVEDHPVSYGSFEGTIPKGQYGGGTVMLWDEGSWEPIGDAHKGLAKGKLEFKLHGKRLQGEWTLVRMRERDKDKDRHNWLLIKRSDEAASEGDTDTLLTKHNTSVISNRSMEKIASSNDRVWKGNKAESKAAPKPAAKKKPKTKALVTDTMPVSKNRARANGKADVGGIAISHPDRIIYQGTGITKQQLAEYYLAVADHILPYVANRPLSMLRCPEGTGEACFFQRHIAQGQSPHLYDTGIKVKGRNEDYMMIKDAKGLITLAQWGVVELHPWGCLADKPELADRIIFDLDPDPTVPFSEVIAAAKDVRSRMQELGLSSFVKTTGGKGLHIIVPITRSYGWPVIKAFARAIAESMEHDNPKLYIAHASKAERKGKIFIDYLRNDLTATAVAAYSARAREGATVAMPLTWQQLTSSLKPSSFTIETVPAILKKRKDPWAEISKLRQKIATQYLRALKIPLK